MSEVFLSLDKLVVRSFFRFLDDDDDDDDDDDESTAMH